MKSERHKKAVYSGKDCDETLKFTKSIKLVNEDIHIKFIIAMGECVLRLLKMAFRSREERFR